MSPDMFPILRASLQSPTRFDAAVEQVFEGVENGSIRNTVLQDAKSALSSAVTNAWTRHVREPYFNGKGNSLPEDVLSLFWSANMMSLHDAIATSKKLKKSKVQGPEIEAMRSFCAEVLPLAKAVASLKDKVVKGHAPSSAPVQPDNPNKVVKTCPVCFRPIAVQSGTMAHHGYTRPGQGWQTASCNGVRFRPLEVSSAGLEWLIDTMRTSLGKLKEAVKNQATQPEFLMAKRSYRGSPEKITRDDPIWPRLFAGYIAEIKAEIVGIERELPVLDKMLADWKPEVADRKSAPLKPDDAVEQYQARISKLPNLERSGGAAFTFWQRASEAIKAAGAPEHVNWHSVEIQTMTESIGEHGQAPQAVADALCKHSPGAVTSDRQSEIRAIVTQLAPELQATYEQSMGDRVNEGYMGTMAS